MGTVDTGRVLTEPLVLPNRRAPGILAVVNLDPANLPVRVLAEHAERGTETIYLRKIGDSCTFALAGYEQVRIEADTYPTTVLLNFTVQDIELVAAPVLDPNGPPIPVQVVNVLAKIALLTDGAPLPLVAGALTPVPLAIVQEAGDPAYVVANAAPNVLTVIRAGVYDVNAMATIDSVGVLMVEANILIGGTALTGGAWNTQEVVPPYITTLGNRAALPFLSGMMRLQPGTLDLSALVQGAAASLSGPLLSATYIGD